MNADAQPLLQIFENKIRLEVPLFQRQYVWNQSQQWEPLWEDISRKFVEHLQGSKDGPVHFLGAMVLDQKQTPIKYVPKRQVIDGQQRLMTVQVFLGAFRDFCRAHGCEQIASEVEKYTLNTGMMADQHTECFKVWPTQADRPVFADVMTLGSKKEIESKHPLVKKKYARKYDPRPRLVEAYLFFYSQLELFFFEGLSEQSIASERPLYERLDECLQALVYSIHVVTIDLEPGDDPQIIFETLNARGEPLLPADLLRNSIFLRAAKGGEKPEELYKAYWRRFDDPFWRDEVTQGRLTRPRSDLFMQHFLASQRMTDIPVKHLYVEYKFWIDRYKPFSTTRDELKLLAEQGDLFRRFLSPAQNDPVGPLAKFLGLFDVGTAYPLLLAFGQTERSNDEWRRLGGVLESFLLRRSVCGWTTQAYNRIFLAVLKQNKDNLTVESIIDHLLAGKGESTEWPTDETFRDRWLNTHAYRALSNPRMVYILKRVSDAMIHAHSEEITIASPLSVEHLMPQAWYSHWRLADGSTGLRMADRLSLPDSDPAKQASERRDRLVQTFGNLTILTQPLNSSVSNGPWTGKLPEILTKSLTPINQKTLTGKTKWDEAAIVARGEELFNYAVLLWPRRV